MWSLPSTKKAKASLLHVHRNQKAHDLHKVEGHREAVVEDRLVLADVLVAADPVVDGLAEVDQEAEDQVVAVRPSFLNYSSSCSVLIATRVNSNGSKP